MTTTEAIGLPEENDRGPAIQLAGGRRFYFLDPRPSEVSIDCIANSLSKLCRFTGQVDSFYSVAQHSVMVSRIVPSAYALWGLLHDSAEAFIGDVSKPLKSLLDDLAPGVLSRIEDRILHCVALRFGLTYPMPSIVKEADNIALATEKRDLMPGSEEWPGLPMPLPERVIGLPPSAAYQLFIDRFEEVAP